MTALAVEINWHARLWRLAAPIILSNLTIPLVGAVDTAIAGHLADAHYLGAVALGSLFFNLIYWGFGFLRMGTTGLTAQAEGARDGEALLLILARALVIAAMIGLAAILLRRPVVELALTLLGGSAAVQDGARTYILARIWSAPAALGNLVLLGWLLGRQRAALGLMLQLLINGANAGTALFFVLALGWGLGGLGAATALADWLGFLAGAAIVLRLVPQGLRLRMAPLFARAPLLRLVTVNRDIFLRTALLLAATSYFTHRSAALGDTVLAANTILIAFQTFMSYGLDGFANAAEALVGVAVGAGDRAAFRAAARTSLLWAAIGGVAIALFYLAAGPAIIGVLSDLAEVRAVAAGFLPWVVLSPLIGAWTFQLDGIFFGATRTAALRNSMAIGLVVFLAGVQILEPAFGNHGLWAAIVLMMTVRGALLTAALPALERSVGSGAAMR